ncbi:Heat shock factor protein 3 [Entomophthora muscae]|uniref:Heat shock factor protein 3 n=2 Tax=Entomophthora muscae TaxID=34485 RepID=A0ACC2USS1_9FUNG|nr:Heat shock factor protein 3 [Entomophthora muscae]KAJ9089819.1 Heat shock factor protein 3 [Entomophthora muscae]
MKRYFKNANLASFFRQLKIYGFERTSDGRKFRGSGRNAFCQFQHPHFKLGGFNELIHVRRQPTKSKSVAILTPQDKYQQFLEKLILDMTIQEPVFQPPQSVEFEPLFILDQSPSWY